MPCAVPETARITALDVLDVRFPTSEHLDGSDAMNPEPDHAAACVILRTDACDGLEGHALAFTTGRGNDVQAAAIAALAPYVVGLSVQYHHRIPEELWSDLRNQQLIRSDTHTAPSARRAPGSRGQHPAADDTRGRSSPCL